MAGLQPKKIYKLHKLKKVTGCERESDFILHFERENPYHARAVYIEKNAFLWKVLQTMKEAYGSYPELENIKLIDLGVYGIHTSHSFSSFLAEDVEDESLTVLQTPRHGEEKSVDQVGEFITKEEEEVLTKLINTYKLDISDVKTATKILSDDLEKKERENIHALLEKQEEWKGVISQLNIAEQHLVYMQNLLSRYIEELNLMRKDIEQIESENNCMEIQATNYSRLLEEVEILHSTLNLDIKYIDVLQNGDFESTSGLQTIIEAVEVLEKGINMKLEDNMDDMVAVIERKDYFRELRGDLVKRFKAWLKKKFFKIADNLLSDKDRFSKKGHLVLSPHTVVFDELSKYKRLMKSVRAVGPSEQNDILAQYVKAMQTPYRKAIYYYFLEIKREIKKHKDSRATSFVLGVRGSEKEMDESTNKSPNAKRSTISLISSPVSNTLSTPERNPRNYRHSYRNSFRHSFDADTLYDSDDDDMTQMSEIIEIENSPNIIRPISKSSNDVVNEAIRVDNGFIKCLTDISNMIYSEQQFCTEYFNLDSKRDVLKDMMEKLFKKVHDWFNSLIDFIDQKTDRFYTLKMLIFTESQLGKFNSDFLGRLFTDILSRLNEVFNRFIDRQLQSIEEYKCIIKRENVVPFVAKFPYFIARIEGILEDVQERNRVEKAYLKIIMKIFECIEKLAESDAKHANSFKMKNYGFLCRAISEKQFQSVDLKKYMSTASIKFHNHRDAYIDWLIKDKFGALFNFFEGVEELKNLKSIDVEDIGYQTQFHRTTLKQIMDSLSKTIENDIDALKKRMHKHLGLKNEQTQLEKDLNLFDETWKYLTDYFIKRFKTFEQLVSECYTNTTLTPSVKQVEEIIMNVNKR